jgi:hypothetical protein
MPSPASGEPMNARLLVDAPDKPASVQFLGVLQGADPGASADPVTLVDGSTSETPCQGVVIKNVAVLFPADVTKPFTTATFTMPASVTKLYVTGLTPGGSYSVVTMPSGGNVTVTVQSGSGSTADAGGVLTH